MRIKEKLKQRRRDFWAIYECEHCGHETDKRSGYDDKNFHMNVIPNMECPECGKTATDEYNPMKTKYPEHLTI